MVCWGGVTLVLWLFCNLVWIVGFAAGLRILIAGFDIIYGFRCVCVGLVRAPEFTSVLGCFVSRGFLWFRGELGLVRAVSLRR